MDIWESIMGILTPENFAMFVACYFMFTMKEEMKEMRTTMAELSKSVNGVLVRLVETETNTSQLLLKSIIAEQLRVRNEKEKGGNKDAIDR